MTTTATTPGRDVAVGALSRWLVALGVTTAAAAVYLLATAGPVAAGGVALVGLLAVWTLLDFERALVGLLVISILIPNGVSIYLGPQLPLLTFQRVMLIVMTGAALLHMPGRTLKGLGATPYIKVLWAMTALMAISTLLSIEPAASRREFFSERGIGIPLYYSLLWLGIPNHAAARRALTAIGVGSSLVLVLAVIEAATGHGVIANLGVLPQEKLVTLGYLVDLERRVGLPRVESVFQHPLLLGAFLVALLPVLVALRHGARSPWARRLWTLELVVGLFALVYTWSRGAWLMLAVAFLLLRSGGLKRWALVGVGAGALFVLAMRLGLLDPGTGLYRVALFRSVVSSLWQRNGLGTGPSTFSEHFTVRELGTMQEIGTDAMAYSLTMAIEVGPLFTALLWWLVLAIIREARAARLDAAAAGERNRVLLLEGLTAGLLANLVLSLFSISVFGVTVGLFFGYLLLIVTVRLARPDPVADG